MLYSNDTATDFSYDTAQDGAGLPARVAIYSDRAHVRCEIEEDLSGAGFKTVEGGALALLLDGPISLLGDVVMVDCPQVDAGTLAALARLDMRVASAGAHMIVTTSLGALESVFGALDQSEPQILVEASRAERLVAVGRTLSQIGNARVREMTEEDRLSLLYLSRQVDAIAHELDKLSGPHGQGALTALADGQSPNKGPNIGPNTDRDLMRNSRQPEMVETAALPDPRTVRQIIARRQARAKFFDSELFADPAWDMLLDLTAAQGERTSVSVTSLCIAAMVPATTALRWVKQLVDCGVFQRKSDPSDKRRAFIALSDQSQEAMARYFQLVQARELEVASVGCDQPIPRLEPQY